MESLRHGPAEELDPLREPLRDLNPVGAKTLN